jgi:uncharacterized protein
MIPGATARSLVLLLIALAALPSCLRLPHESPKPRFWVLSAMDGEIRPAPIARALALTDVDLPSYLDRSEIVTRTSATRLQIAPFDLWAQPLRDAVEQVVGHNVEMLVPGTVAGSRDRAGARGGAAYRLRIRVFQFEAGPDGAITLKGAFLLRAPGGEGRQPDAGSFERVAIREPATGTGLDGTVSAMSRALAALSERIAARLREVEAGAGQAPAQSEDPGASAAQE